MSSGFDVVESVIERNKEQLAPLSPRVAFQVAELSQGLPTSGFDLILSRDALQHLPWTTAADVLQGYW